MLSISGDNNDELEVKQAQVSQYENMQISAIFHGGDKDADSNNPDSGKALYIAI